MEKIQLNNGLRVVMEQIPNVRSVSFGIWVKTGSRHENEMNSGISHFIEHMLFKGTDRFSAKEIAEEFDAIGGNVNAFTSREYTCYYAKVLDEHLPIAMDVLSDMFFNSKLDPEELDREKNVIVEEISMYEDTPDDIVHDLVSRAAYGHHPLAYPVLGAEERLQVMDSAQLRSYIKEHYTVENTVISLTGHIGDDVVERLEKYFGHFNNYGHSSKLDVPSFTGQLLFHEKSTEQNHICLSFPGCAMGEPLQYAMILLNNALGGGMSSRLFQEIREKRGLAYSVYSYHSSHSDSGLLTIYAGTAPRQTQDVLELSQELLYDVAVNGLTSTELGKGKEQLKGSLILSLEGTGSRMNRNGKNELMLGRHDTLDEMIRNIERVTMDDVHAVLDRVFSQPFAAALVGGSDAAVTGLRRDQFALLRRNS